ncbi:FtsK/SpoIIIE domain-containing protein [Tsukamurella soli]|uniref:AAA+ ATPase domain-containing protein n=1 Tax=Tsukamurella soli TaxID=644556 RepID=A0ABP8KAU2_9ACTN
MADYVNPFASYVDAPAPAEPPAETSAAAPDPEPDFAAEQAAQAEAQERALQHAAAEYVAMLPAIEAARPLPATAGRTTELTGAERIAAGVRSALRNNVGSTVQIVRDAVVADVPVKPGVNAHRHGAYLAEYLYAQGNLGQFEAHVRPADGHILLIRRGVAGPGVAWRAAGPRAQKFYEDAAYRDKAFDLVRLRQTRKSDGARRYPRVREWGEDSRGGTVTLDLCPGMLLGQVRAAEPALRQALNLPSLVVDSVGMRPLIRLNSREITRDFPKRNPLLPALFTRPRTQAERHAAAGDFVIPLGVRADGSPILISQAVAPHMGIFGGTGMGKTVLLTQLVQAAVLQGAEVLLVDAKNGKDLRRIAMLNLPGVVHYSAGSEATLHRAVRYVRDEFERRKALAAALMRDGIEYRPVPLLLVFDEAPAWIDDQISGTDKDARKAAETTVANLSWIASQAREQKCFILTAGQYAYASAFAGRWKSNTQTLVILGPPSEINRQSLFAAGEPRDRVKVLGAQLTKSMKGRGIVADAETGEIQLFQGFFNDGEHADAFARALAETPRLRRFAWEFPLPGHDGGDGSWMDWTPTSEPSSDDLPVVYLDGPDGEPDPGVEVYDPTSKRYAPGTRRLRDEHEHRNSYDQK